MQALVPLKSSLKPMYTTRNVSQKCPLSKVQFAGTTLKERKSTRQNAKQMKRISASGDELLHDIVEMAINNSIA
eukprot:1625090-Ditylum_brightwellii.AAC.1